MPSCEALCHEGDEAHGLQGHEDDHEEEADEEAKEPTMKEPIKKPAMKKNEPMQAMSPEQARPDGRLHAWMQDKFEPRCHGAWPYCAKPQIAFHGAFGAGPKTAMNPWSKGYTI